MKKIIDVSGYGHSGKSSISEFLSDHEDFFSFPVNVEFELFRVSGGILDLYYSIYENWNLIRANKSIIDFQKLIYRIGIIQNKKSPMTFWKSSGHGYNQFFNNQFINISERYINDLVVFKQNTFWPYKRLYLSKFDLFAVKLKSKLFKNISTSNVLYTNRNNFINKTSKYIHFLFDNIQDKLSSNIILNNAFDPYNPNVCLKIIENSFSIVVERDPRDIYASLIDSKIRYIPEFEKDNIFKDLKKKILSIEKVDDFILRYRTLKENVLYQEHPRLLRIRFEDFILNHNEVKDQIYKFLGNDNFIKKNIVKFNPEDSSENIGIWKDYRDLPEIKKIESELSEYCYQN
tara:strand:- start:1735 stop:2772 length:1038 start_codon:yes stop_codon:yes gene_type:complete